MEGVSDSVLAGGVPLGTLTLGLGYFPPRTGVPLSPGTGVLPQKGHGTSASIMGWGPPGKDTGPVQVLLDVDGIPLPSEVGGNNSL